MNIRGTLAVSALALLLWTSISLADDGTMAQPANYATNDAYLSRIDALERELAELQAQVDEAKGDGCGTSNWYAGFDFAILQPHLGAVEANVFGVGVDLLPDFDYALAPRVWLAYDNPNGLGVRVSYWQFDNQTDSSSTVLGDVAVGLEAHTLDAEMTQRGSVGCLDFQVAGGVRYGNLRHDFAFAQVDTVLAGDFEGTGPTVAVDARRPFGNRGVAFVGGVRGAWLYGALGLEGKAADHMMQVWTTNVGGEWSRAVGTGGQVVVRALWEAQAWEAPRLTLIHEDIGFSGPTVSLGYVW